MSKTPIEHEYQRHATLNRDVCRFRYSYNGRDATCLQREDHQWHYKTRCTKCNDSGILWEMVAHPLRPGYPGTSLMVSTAKSCPDCEEGELMGEFLDQ